MASAAGGEDADLGEDTDFGDLGDLGDVGDLGEATAGVADVAACVLESAMISDSELDGSGKWCRMVLENGKERGGNITGKGTGPFINPLVCLPVCPANRVPF